MTGISTVAATTRALRRGSSGFGRAARARGAGGRRIGAGLALFCLAAMALPAAVAAQGAGQANDAAAADDARPPLSYEQQVSEAEAARRAYEEELARRQVEQERAEADYQERLREYEADPAVQRARASSCEAQNAVHRERAGRVGRFLGGVVGSVAGESAAARTEGWVTRLGTSVGEAISSLLNCTEQAQAEAATEEALAGGVGTTVTWTSESRPNVTGSSTVTALEDREDGGRCLTVTDIVIVDGEETRAPKQMCRIPPSNRFVRV